MSQHTGPYHTSIPCGWCISNPDVELSSVLFPCSSPRPGSRRSAHPSTPRRSRVRMRQTIVGGPPARFALIVVHALPAGPDMIGTLSCPCRFAPLCAAQAGWLAQAHYRGRSFCGRSFLVRIAGSKEWAHKFMARHNVPTSQYQAFTDAEAACDHVDNADYAALVVKADGLAAGKGVVVSEPLPHPPFVVYLAQPRLGLPLRSPLPLSC